MKKTTVINLFGGPGSGKSTLSAELFVELKKQQKNVELVREYVKDWAYENRGVGKFDQVYIAGKQSHKESSLYHKVDYIVTDSPMLLSPFYQQYYQGETYVLSSILNLMRAAREDNIIYKNFYLKRNKPYNPVGRYENEEEAKKIDGEIKKFLEVNDISHTHLICDDNEKVKEIVNQLDI